MFYWLRSLFSALCQKKRKPIAATFEIFKDKSKQYRFRLKAKNGEIILASEGYTTKASANKGIASVKANASFDSCYERKDAKNGQPMFNLKAANHEVIGTSERYSSNAARDGGIFSVKANALYAEVVDLT